ncbi:MAG: c-type cytochrome biogenesis protein CcsB [Candidatus Sumerlaeia bacterium]|nr:c-type cytochrome biogenesis protein CcsB [Candidatus Sumerlaeia bacterium]
MKLTQLLSWLLAAILLAAPSAAQTLSDDDSSRFSTIPHSAEMERAIVSSPAERLVVMTDGIRETLLTASRIRLDELTGRTEIRGQDPEYTFLSMVYEPERWWDAAILPLEHPRVAEILGADGKWVSAHFVAANPSLARLEGSAAEAAKHKADFDAMTRRLNAAEQVLRLRDRELALSSLATEELPREAILELVEDPAKRRESLRERASLADKVAEEKAFLEATQRLFHRVSMVGGMRDHLVLVPNREDIRGDWFRPGEGTPGRGDEAVFEAAKRLDAALASAFRQAEPSDVPRAVAAFLDVAEDHPSYPPLERRAVKNAYKEMNPFRSAAGLFMASAVGFGFFFFFGRSPLRWIGTGLFGLAFIAQTFGVGTRLYISGHMPVSNMYESITFTCWVAMLLAGGIELRRRDGVAGIGAAILGFLMLAGASSMPLHDTRFHPLRAVLNSYWLNIHVTAMLISYAAFALAAVFAAAYLLKSATGREALFGGRPIMTLDQTEQFTYRLVQVGWPILTLGITLGAVWADVAWGRYWGWDPKETWAFITWIVYTVYLHSRMVMGWRGRLSAAACVLGFVCVVITWLGVSYHPWFSGGLHSYASPT